MIRKVFLGMVAVAVLAGTVQTAQAQSADFWAVNTNGDTLYYTIIGNNEVSVSSTDDLDWRRLQLSGTLVIPSTVTHEGTAYTVTTINDFADCNYSALDIPNTVTVLGQGCFSQCTTLTAVTLPSSVVEIQQGAFHGCIALTSATIPNSVNIIGDGAFGGDTALRSVTLPDSTTMVGNAPFGACKLTQPLYNSTHFMYMPQDYSGEYTIPDGIQSVCGGVFEFCVGLTGIHFPASVETIGRCAFWGCTGLTSVVLPSHLLAVPENMFWGCTALRSVDITSNTLMRIGGGAFSGATALTRVTIKTVLPPAVNSISLLIGDITFDTLIVPCGARQAYLDADYWNEVPVIEEDCNSIDDLEVMGYRLWVMDGRIVVEGAEDETVSVYDITGRLTHTFKHSSNQALPSGTYIIKIGNHAAQKVVVIR